MVLVHENGEEGINISSLEGNGSVSPQFQAVPAASSQTVCGNFTVPAASSNTTCAISRIPPASSQFSPMRNNEDFSEEICDWESSCPKCSKAIISKQDWEQHQKQCDADEKKKCKWCNRIFSSVKNKYKHTVICKVRKQIEASKLRNFGDENVSYLSHDFLVRCVKSGELGIYDIIAEIFFNANHIENHNFRLVSLKHTVVEVYRNENWIPGGMREVCDAMINRASQLMRSVEYKDVEMYMEQNDYQSIIIKIADMQGYTWRIIRDRVKARILYQKIKRDI
jgi:hypothetical protein